MNNWTRAFLVVLRVAIGWHFLFEGVSKLESLARGPADGKPAWSSEPYLREATGPLAWYFREQAGDLDAHALARLTLPEKGPEKGKEQSLPGALLRDWDEQFELFLAHYAVGSTVKVQPEQVGLLAVAPTAGMPFGLPWPALARTPTSKDTTPEKLQLILLKADYAQVKSNTLHWLQAGERQAPRVFAEIEATIPESTPKRLKAYKDKLAAIAEFENHGMQAMGQDAPKDKLKTLKKEATALRVELMADLNKPFNDLLIFGRDGRLSKGAVPQQSASTVGLVSTQVGQSPLVSAAQASAALGLTPTFKPGQVDKGPPPELPTDPHMKRINLITAWGLTIVGGCLIVGLFTRLSCIAGAAFLCMIYATMPALPWLPVNPKSEGHYFFVNKNIIELLALMALATTRSGHWLGIDALLSYLNPFTSRNDDSTSEAPTSPNRSPAYAGGNRTDKSAKEAVHGT